MSIPSAQISNVKAACDISLTPMLHLDINVCVSTNKISNLKLAHVENWGWDDEG